MFQLMVLNPGMTPAQAERAYRRLYDDTRRRMGGAFDWPTLKLSIPGRAERLRELWQLAYGHGHAGFPERRGNPSHPQFGRWGPVKDYTGARVRLRSGATGRISEIRRDEVLGQRMAVVKDEAGRRLGEFALAALELLEENPGRPPKGWWRSCTAGVGPGYDPARVCGATWSRMGAAQRRAAMARHERNPGGMFAPESLITYDEQGNWYIVESDKPIPPADLFRLATSSDPRVFGPFSSEAEAVRQQRTENPSHWYKVIARDSATGKWHRVGWRQSLAEAVAVARDLPMLSSGSGRTYSPYNDIIVKDVGTRKGTPFLGTIVFRLVRSFDGHRERWDESTPNPSPAWHRSAAREYAGRVRADESAGHGGAADYWQGALAAESRALAVEPNPGGRRVGWDFKLPFGIRGRFKGVGTLTGRRHGATVEVRVLHSNSRGAPPGSRVWLTTGQLVRANPGESPEEADADSVRELDLFAETESRLYNQRKSITANLMQKLAKGTYNPALAPKLWYYWYDAAAKLYAREFGGPVFSTAVRRAAAEARAREEYEKMVGGEYGELPVFKTRGGLTRQHYLGGRAANPYAVKYTDMGGRERGAFFRDRRAFERWQDRTLGKSVKGFTLTGRVEPREISRRMKGNPACPAKAGFRAFHDADPDRAWKVKVPDSFPARLYMIGKLHKLVLDTGAQLTGGVLAAGSGNRLYVIGARGAGPAAARAVQVEYIPPKVSRKAGAVYFHKFTRPPQVRRVGSGGHYTVAGRGVRLTPRGIVG